MTPMVRASLMLIAFMMCLLPDSVAQQQEQYERIKSLIESYQFSQAVSLAERFLEQDSTSTELLLLKGKAHAAGFQYRESIETLCKALRSDSANVKVLNELVNVYKQSGDQEKAISVAEKLCAMEHENRFFGLQLAGLYVAEQEYGRAVGVLHRLYLQDSSDFYVAKQLGNCYSELKKHDSAVSYYKRALKISPFDQVVTGKLINTLVRMNEVAMALYLTQVFLAHDPVNIPVLKQQGYCYYLLIDFKWAAKILMECARLGDSSRFTMKYLGLSYYKLEKYDSAAPFFMKAYRSDTTDAEVCFYTGVSFCRVNMVDTGIAMLQKTLNLLMPSEKFLSGLYVELASAFTDSGHPDTALVVLKKALCTYPFNSTLLFRIAYQYDYHLREPLFALPLYQEFLANSGDVPESDIKLPQQLSRIDYAQRRVEQLNGKRGSK